MNDEQKLKILEEYVGSIFEDICESVDELKKQLYNFGKGLNKALESETTNAIINLVEALDDFIKQVAETE